MNRFKFLPILLLLIASILSGGDEEHSVHYCESPSLVGLQGVVLIPSQDYAEYCSTKGVRGLKAYDLCVPGGAACLAEAIEPFFMGRPLTNELLQELKEQIVLYYRDHNRPVVSVYVPEQQVENGVLKLVVMEGCVGQVAASGNRWFSNWLYESFIRLGPGDAITADTLLTDVAWLNRNPFRNVDVIFTPGCEVGTTNIELVVCDRCPIQLYVGADNTGTDATGVDRIYAGATWGNAFWLDHIATYQYTTSHCFREFQSHTFHYTAPVFWRHLLLLFGGYSSVHPASGEFGGSNGSFFQSSVRYVVPFGCNYNAHIQEWSVGFDYKYFDNNLFFTSDEGLELITEPVDLSQFVIGYAYACENACQRFSFNFDLYGSPGKLLPKEEDVRYQKLSPGSQVRYLYGKVTMGETLYLPWDLTGSLLGRFQLASHNLLPSERFGLGGFDTIRGYDERIFNVDSAFVFNAELRSPCLSLIDLFGGESCCCDEMLFLIFFDYGIGWLNSQEQLAGFAFPEGQGFGKAEYLMSFGPGWRYTINCYLSARVDWGIKLHRLPEIDTSNSHWHVGLVLSY